MDINMVIAIYSELAGVTVEADEQVRQLPGLIHYPSPYPAMTRAEARVFLEKGLREQLGVVVKQPDPKRVVFQLGQ